MHLRFRSDSLSFVPVHPWIRASGFTIRKGTRLTDLRRPLEATSQRRKQISIAGQLGPCAVQPRFTYYQPGDCQCRDRICRPNRRKFTHGGAIIFKRQSKASSKIMQLINFITKQSLSRTVNVILPQGARAVLCKSPPPPIGLGRVTVSSEMHGQASQPRSRLSWLIIGRGPIGTAQQVHLFSPQFNASRNRSNTWTRGFDSN
jgi:hypothetical protein